MLCAGNSSVEAVKDFLKDSFTQAGAAAELLEEANKLVDQLAAEHPGTTDVAEGSSKSSSESLISHEGVLEVAEDEPAQFKASLVPSTAAWPVRALEEFKGEPERRGGEEEQAAAAKKAAHL